jgi:hypothetical protein
MLILNCLFLLFSFAPQFSLSKTRVQGHCQAAGVGIDKLLQIADARDTTFKSSKSDMSDNNEKPEPEFMQKPWEQPPPQPIDDDDARQACLEFRRLKFVRARVIL